MNRFFFYFHPFETAELQPEAEEVLGLVTAVVPPGDSCCTESMLGLRNIAPKQDIWQLFRVSSVFKVFK